MGNLLGERAKLHAIWAIAHIRGAGAVDHLLRIAASDAPPSLRVQAIRAVADLTDPVLAEHKLAAGRGREAVAVRMAECGKGAERRVLLEVIVALGRLRWANLPQWLIEINLKQPDVRAAYGDPTLSHAAMQALRRSDDWTVVLEILALPVGNPLRTIALQAVAERFEPVVVDGLIENLAYKKDRAQRYEYVDALTRIYKKPAPWVYWDYRPKPRPANTVAWERTEAIGAALDKVLLDSEASVRLVVLKRMQREKIPAGLTVLGKWLEVERNEEYVALLLAALRDHPARDIRPHLARIIREGGQSDANRLVAVEMFVTGPEGPTAEEFLGLAKALTDGPVLAALLRHSANVAKAAAIP